MTEMNNSSGQARIGAAFKWFGYLCFVIAITVMFYHDSRHLPSRPLGAVFFGIIPGLISWLVGWAIQRNAKAD
jgi:1,4-dihydroxy-2-naphthoate octaprenyltransferase